MKCSVVIAAYNASSTIRAALLSCLSQSIPAFEIIVVNDASTDATAEIVQEFLPTVKLISFAENKGVSAARNAGWEDASGDYVAFLDSDDTWHTDKLFWVKASIEKYPSVPFLAHSFTIEKKPAEGLLNTPNTTKLNFSKLLLRNQIQGSCIVVKRAIAQRFDDSMRYCEDYDLALRCAYQQAILFIEAPLSILLRPQQSQGGLSANKWAMRKGELYLFSKLGELNPLLMLGMPILWLYSLAKHLLQKLQ